MPSPSTLNDGQAAAPPDPEPGKRRVDHSVDSRQRAFAITVHTVLLIRAPKLRYINFGARRVIHTPADARLRRIVQKKIRHSSGCGPMVVAEHSAEALSALNRVMG